MGNMSELTSKFERREVGGERFSVGHSGYTREGGSGVQGQVLVLGGFEASGPRETLSQ